MGTVTTIAMDEAASLYVHIPFCRTRCTYCAFNTYAGLDALIGPYLDALQREMALVGQAAPHPRAHTLYLGGGTPSLLTPAQVAGVVAAAQAHLGLAEGVEITLEANPGDLSADRLAGFRAAGVNRLSLGVQSAHADELRMFGRRHSSAEAGEAFRRARAAGFSNVSIDLIYGAPNQTRHKWRESLDTLLSWGPDHVSLYSLTLEPGTPLARRVERGTLPAPDPDLAADMYDDARARLSREGLAQYEISNWARPGCESQHNRQYWLNRPFLGMGAGAHGSAAGVRTWNVNPVREYIARVMAGEAQAFPLSPAFEGYEVIDLPLEMSETVILGLRLVHEGVSKSGFAWRFGRSLDEVFGPALEALEQAGLLAINGDQVRLTERAYLVSNQVFVRLLPEEA